MTATSCVPKPAVVMCQDQSETHALAARLASELCAGDVVLLDGPLAAGKTAFVAALCTALGTTRPASSPTYTLSHIYPAERFDVIHVDAYRLTGLQAFEDLGLDEFLQEAALVVEWGQNVAEGFETCLHVRIAFGDSETERRIELAAHGARWQPVIARLAGG